mgnify:CR=1 FL=1
MKLQLSCDEVTTDFMVVDGNHVVCASIASYSAITLNSFVSGMLLSNRILMDNREGMYGRLLEGHRTAVRSGKINIYHSMLFSRLFRDKKNRQVDGYYENCYYFTVSSDQILNEVLYQKLLTNFDLPIKIEWMNYIIQRLERGGNLEELVVYMEDGCELADNKFYKLELDQEGLDAIVSEGLQCRAIKVVDASQRPLEFKDLDEYFLKYGQDILVNTLKVIDPISERNSVVTVPNKTRVPYPEQAEIVNGTIKFLQNSRHVIINGDMGTGKTLMSCLSIEGYYLERYMKSNPKASLQEATENISYRVAVMCPGHLAQKWKEEIESEIIGASVVVVRRLNDLVELNEHHKEKPKGKFFFIFPKDSTKLGYSKVPVPFKKGKKHVKMYRCEHCYSVYSEGDFKKNDGVCPSCKKEVEYKKYNFEKSELAYRGALCPYCRELMFDKTVSKEKLDSMEVNPLSLLDFDSEKKGNSVCNSCGSTLWAPLVRNLGRENNLRGWKRVKYFRNKARKGTQIKWVHESVLNDFVLDKDLEERDYEVVKPEFTRRAVMSKYIQRKMRKFFDLAVIDEAHLYKAGASAQAIAMHHIVKSSSKVIALTGTLVGGVASDLFYMLFKLCPQNIVKEGYGYNDVMRFSEDYGVIETKFYFDKEEEVNSMSSGRKMSAPSVKPGINPEFFPRFLFGSTLFLSIEDMGRFLPPLYEYPVMVDMREDMKAEYEEYKRTVKPLFRKEGGRKLLASCNQINMSYPDKPDQNALLHPKDGKLIFDFDCKLTEKLLPKEEALVENIKNGLAEGRNAFVYTEYTGGNDKDITGRLKDIIEKYCNLQGKVAILYSSAPEAAKRMDWIRKKAASGIRVFICNPKCVETGLDFVFKEAGKTYNFPDIHFFQIPMSLFTMWQASKRHYRLNQTDECRTYYYAYQGTRQAEWMKVMALKKVVTQTIQGSLTSQGLSALAEGVDERILFARELAGNIDENEINDLFGQINQSNNSFALSDADKEFLKQVKDRAGLTEKSEIEDVDHMDITDFIDFISAASQVTIEETLKEKEDEDTHSILDELFFGFQGGFNSDTRTGKMVVEETERRGSKSKNKEGQLTLFTF